MDKVLILALIAIWSSFFSNSALADGDLEKLLQHIQKDGIQESSDSTEPESSEMLWWESGEVDYSFDFTTLDPKMSFILAYDDLSNYQLEQFNTQEIAAFVKKLLQHKLIETFDEHYSETKFTCEMTIERGSKEAKKCEHLLNIYEQFSNEIEQQIDIPPTQGGKVEDLFGITLDGDKITQMNAIDEDPHQELKKEADATANRNSVILRHHIVKEVTQEDTELTLQTAICNIQERQKLNIDQKVLAHSVSILKESLIDLGDEVSLKEKQEAFCTLYEYWNATDNLDEIIEFLYLHQPDGELPCQ